MEQTFSISQLAGPEKWLSQRQVAQLLGVKTSIVADLIRYLYKTGELDQRATTRKQQVVQTEGKRQVSREVNCYSRAVVLAVAWRVHSDRGEQFRQWASHLLEQQLVQGYTLDLEQLAGLPESVATLQQTVASLVVETPAAETAAVISGDGELGALLTVFRIGLQKLFEFEYNKVALRNTSMLAARPLEYFEVGRALSWLRETLFAPGEANGFAIEKPGQLESLLVLVSGQGTMGKSYPSI